MNEKGLLNIGAFAVSTGLSIAALRHYDEIGLLKPTLVDLTGSDSLLRCGSCRSGSLPSMNSLRREQRCPRCRRSGPYRSGSRVTDVHEAAIFYTTAFDVVFNEGISSLQFGTYRTDRFFLIALEACGEDSSGVGAAHFGLLVDDVNAAHDRALSAGAAEVHPPADLAWKPRTSCVRDPSGNRIDLTQS